MERKHNENGLSSFLFNFDSRKTISWWETIMCNNSNSARICVAAHVYRWVDERVTEQSFFEENIAFVATLLAHFFLMFGFIYLLILYFLSHVVFSVYIFLLQSIDMYKRCTFLIRQLGILTCFTCVGRMSAVSSYLYASTAGEWCGVYIQKISTDRHAGCIGRRNGNEFFPCKYFYRVVCAWTCAWEDCIFFLLGDIFPEAAKPPTKKSRIKKGGYNGDLMCHHTFRALRNRSSFVSFEHSSASK